MKVQALTNIVGLTGKDSITRAGDVLDVPFAHPDLPGFLEQGLLRKLPDTNERLVTLTADEKPVKAVKPKSPKG